MKRRLDLSFLQAGVVAEIGVIESTVSNWEQVRRTKGLDPAILVF